LQQQVLMMSEDCYVRLIMLSQSADHTVIGIGEHVMVTGMRHSNALPDKQA